jgi:hypothetical protein
MRGRIYIGTSLQNAKRANELQARFKKAGCEITYDWTTHGQVYSDEELAEYGLAEETGVKNADVFFMVFPARKGSHCELGLARAFGVKIVLLTEQDTMGEKKTFYFLPEVQNRPIVSRFRDEDKAVQFTLDYLDTKYGRSNPQST